MKLVLTLCLAVVAAASLLSASSADSMSSSTTTAAPTIVTPDSLKWTEVKGVDGAQMAVVYGDPTTAGSLYTVRMKFEAGTKVPIHWHDGAERVTVLSGSLMVGVGTSWNMTTMKTLAPGSFVYMPAGVRHYAMAKSETVIQITGSGPMTLNVVK